MSATEDQGFPHTIIDNLSDGIILLDDARLITDINSVALRLLDLNRAQAYSLPLNQVIELPAEIFDPTDILPHLHVPVSVKRKSGLVIKF